VYGNLSSVFQDLGRLDEALTMCSSALEIFNKASGDKQKSIAICHNNMGNILEEQGKPDEAMEHYSMGLAITLETEGETSRAANFLGNIGAVMIRQNKLDEAMEKYFSALRIYERAKSVTRVATCHQNIGYSLMQQGKFDEALEHARKALEIRRSKLSCEHADCGQSRLCHRRHPQAQRKVCRSSGRVRQHSTHSQERVWRDDTQGRGSLREQGVLPLRVAKVARGCDVLRGDDPHSHCSSRCG
jgi:tetratricopeptide (TPR) repeat protein